MSLKGIKTKDFLVICWVVGIIVVGEILFRLSYFGVDSFLHPTRYSPRGNTLTRLVIPAQDDSLLVYTLRPKLKTYFKGALFSTNGRGVRGNGSIFRKENELSFRIAVLGASITMGAGVADNETFVAKLQDKFDAYFSEGVDVVNFGVGGYTMIQIAEYYKRIVAGRFTPDLIVLPIYYDGYGSLGQCVPQNPPNLRDYRPKWDSLRGYLIDFFAFNALREEIGHWIQKYLSVDWIARGIGTSEKSCLKNSEVLSRFIRDRFKENIPVVLVALHRTRESAGAEKERSAKFLHDWCKTQPGVYLMDTIPELQTLVSPGDQIYPGDSHPNARVHSLYANALYPKLLDKVLLLSEQRKGRGAEGVEY